MRAATWGASSASSERSDADFNPIPFQVTGGAIDQTFLTGKRSHPAAPLPRNFRVSHARSDAPFLLKEKGKRAKDSKRRPAAQPRAQHAHKPQQQQQHRPGRGAGPGLGLACESTRARISSKEKPTAHSSQPFTEWAKKTSRAGHRK